VLHVNCSHWHFLTLGFRLPSKSLTNFILSSLCQHDAFSPCHQMHILITHKHFKSKTSSMHISKLLVATKKFFCLIASSFVSCSFVLFHAASYACGVCSSLHIYDLWIDFLFVYIPCRLQWVRRQTRNADKVSKDQVPNKEIHRW